MKTALTIILAVTAGIVVGGVSVTYFQDTDSTDDGGEAKPLYWVAPMDNSYRRDKPGKSPMGMDLVPVYADNNDADDSPGTVSISPTVVNNLGVKTASVTRGVLDTQIKTVGYVQYNEDNLVHIHPRVEGWIDTLYIKAQGDPVEKNAPLYTLYSPQLVNAQEEYLIALKRSDNTLIRAAKQRLAALQLSSGFIQNLTQTGVVEQTVTFYAPQSGVVDALQIREGFYVKPGTTVMSIGKLDSVWVEAEVFESDSVLIEAGQPVTMTLDYLPGKIWQGRIDYIYPSLNPVTRTLRVRLAFDNDDNALKPNMFAQLTIHARQGESTLLVPRNAVISTGSQERVVQVQAEGKFKSVEVTTGRASGGEIQILQGLKENDKVVVSAQFLIDSESSKSSDFIRLSDTREPGPVPQATVNGVIQAVVPAKRVMTVHREAIEKWNRPATTMDFIVAKNIELTDYQPGDTIRFTFEAGEDFVITQITPRQTNTDKHSGHDKPPQKQNGIHNPHHGVRP